MSSIWRSLSIVVLITTAVVAASIVHAATVTTANDYPSTLQAGESANHHVVFTTPSGVAEGETVTLTFASDFDTSSLVEDDIDVEDDDTELTTAADCSGSEQVAISIASDVVTLEVCAGDGGAIAATSVVEVEIGTNATASGTGSNQITNPTSAGTYFLSIAGTFGDTGSIALPIGSDDSVAVTATVPDLTPDPGSETDTSPPYITDVVVSSITATTATVTWTTNEGATTAVDYGLTVYFELGTEYDASLVTSHSMTLTGLTGSTTYYIRARSADGNANESSSPTYSFTTLDGTGPVISGIEVIDITAYTATITWDTDEDADSLVSYGETESYGSSESDSEYVIAHSILLSGLAAETEYHYQIRSIDELGNETYSDDYTFSTIADEAPTNVSDLAVEEGDQELVLTWTNPDEDDLAGVLILYCEDEHPSGPDDEDCVEAFDSLAETATLNGLTNDVTYYLGVFVYDEIGQFASGALGTGTPSAPVEEPPDDEEDPPDDGEDQDAGGEEGDDGGGGEEGDDATPPDDGGGGEEDDDDADEAVVCGDGICAESESEYSCPADCSVSDPDSMGAESGDLDVQDMGFLVAGGEIELEINDSGVVDVLPTSTLRIEIPVSELSDDIENVTLKIGSDQYLMSLDETSVLYSAQVTTPDSVATYLVSIEVTYADDSEENVSSLLRVKSDGIVYQDIDGEEAPLPGVTVTLSEQIDGEFVVWDGSPYSQLNPIQTPPAGTFAWYVQNGTYELQAQIDGFNETKVGSLTITNWIVNPSIEMTPQDEEEEEDVLIDDTQESEPDAQEQVSTDKEPETIIEAILDNPVGEVVEETLETIRELPGVEEAAEVSVPALVVTAGASTVVMAIAFDFLPFLQYLFTAPILFFWRRKRKGFGVVYNAISKTPIDLAVVRLFELTPEAEAQNLPGRLVKSRVTDKAGRYFFLAKPGRYYIAVSKAGYDFPSAYLQGQPTDGNMLDLYHGHTIEVTQDDAVITANIPMDPSQTEKFHAPSSIMWRARLRVFQHVVAMLGVIAAVVFAIIRPTPLSIAMIAVQVVVYLLARRLAKPRKPISWGIVYDSQTGRPLSRVVARIFEPTYNKLLETQVTDSKGRYAFMLGPNQYFAVFERNGFNPKEIRPIDFTQTTEAQNFSEDIGLDPNANQ